MFRRPAAITSVPWTPALARLLERASTALARLDARVSASFAGSIWQTRAAWSGYAAALQLQGEEIDEIDIYSWGSGVLVPGRRTLPTTHDLFAGFAPWRAQFAGNARRHWREDLGIHVIPEPDYAGPRLIGALEALRQISVREPSIDAWLSLPLLLQRMGITRGLLPCLVIGEKRLRFDQPADDAQLRRLLKAIAEVANTGLTNLVAVERWRLRAAGITREASRPGALPRLVARFETRPVASPQQIADEFQLSIGGAGKLLRRAADKGLLDEVRGKQAWKLYMPPELAVALGLSSPPRGRPRAETPPLPSDPNFAAFLEAFDAEMAEFDDANGPAQ